MFAKFLHQTPFVRFVIPFILGILLQDYFVISHSLIFYIFILCLILSIILLKLASNYKFNLLWGVLVSLTLFFAGMQRISIKQVNEYHFKNQQNMVIATISGQPEEKENSIKTILKIDQVQDTLGWLTNNSKILCYFQKDRINQTLQMGDQIVAKININKIKNSGNPYTFDYKQYLKYKEINYQTFIQSDQFKVLAHNKGSKLFLLSNKVRQKLLHIYRENKIEGDEFAVLSALTLGYKTELTTELKQSYSISGAMHVLAVSGLHVGIIFIILSKLLFFLQKNKYGKIIQYSIIICFLFFYAFLTGLSSSVLRATIMFTFICFGNMFTRLKNIYNTIAASAFILLLYNPYLIMDVGFQLSYAAVLSIVFFQPKIYSLIKINSTFPDYIWQLVSVAIAAQLGTFPITIYYFDQFPLYFILSNILIIPIATIIIYGAILLFIFSFSKSISFFIAKALYYTTLFMNHNVRFIESLPYSKLNTLLNQNEVIILIALVLSISFFIISKRTSIFKFSLWVLMTFLSYHLFLSYEKSQNSLLVVYNIKSLSAIEFTDGNHDHLYTSKEMDINDKNMIYNITPLWKNEKIKNHRILCETKDSNLIESFQFKNQRIIQIKNNNILNYNSPQKLSVDYIILSENVNIRIKDLNNLFDYKKLIFDSSNSSYHIRNWETECTKQNTSFFDVTKNGAFVKAFD